MDNKFTTKQRKHGRRRSSVTRNNIVLWKNVIWNNFKSNHKISNQITRFPNQNIILKIKSLCVIQSWFKSNHDL